MRTHRQAIIGRDVPRYVCRSGRSSGHLCGAMNSPFVLVLACLFALPFCCLSLLGPQQQHPLVSFLNRGRPTTKLYYDNVDDRQRLQRAELLFVLPLNSMKLADITSLNKALVDEPFKAVISKANLIDMVDRTPYCQIVDFLSDQNICFFVDHYEKENYEAFTKWIRQLKRGKEFSKDSKAFEILLCKKEHFIKFSSVDWSE